MRDLKFGVNLRFRNPEPWKRDWKIIYDEHVEMARLAEELGFDGVFVPEHHSLPDGYTPSPFTILSALAMVTKRLRLGTQPLLLPLNHPVAVADDICSLDILSDGRSILGIGAGYRLGDFQAFGRRLEDRGKQMDEACEILIRCLVEKSPFSFEGDFYTVHNVRVSPPSLQRPHPPIVMPVRSRASALRAARYGFSANMLPIQGDVDRHYSVYCQGLEENGWNAQERDVSILLDGFIDSDAERAQQAAGAYLSWAAEMDTQYKNEAGVVDAGDRRIIEGRSAARPPWTAAEWVSAIEDQQRFFSRGPVPLGWVNVSVWPAGMPFETGAQAMRLFAEEVIPRFR